MFYQLDIIYQCIIALVLAIVFSSLIVTLLIKIQTKKCLFQPIRAELTFHKEKDRTPTLGGIAIFVGGILSLLITNYKCIYKKELIVMLLVFFCFFLVGLCDDLLKLFYKNYKGMKESIRVVVEIILSVCFLRFCDVDIGNVYFFDHYFYLGIFGLVFLVFVLVGSSNSMNLSDGLDGLATCLFIICLMPFIIYCFKQSEYLIGLFLVCCFGSSIGFIMFNMHPSKIFMGDSGSLYLGSILGGIAIFFQLEYILLISGFVLIIETLSVIIQVIYYKITHKRFFLMAPLHHHFEMKGYSEEKVVLVFMVVGYFFSFLAMLMII